MLKTEVNGINAALEQLYEEVPGTEVRMLCSTLQQSIKYGSSIYQVLIDLSKEMRELQLLNTEEKVASLSAKMTLPMIAFIMFPRWLSLRAGFYRDGVNVVKIISLTTLLALFVLCGCQSQTSDGGELNDSQREYILSKVNNYNGLIKLYREKLSRKEDKDTRYQLAEYYYLAEDFDSSRQYLQPLIANNPDERALLLASKI